MNLLNTVEVSAWMEDKVSIVRENNQQAFIIKELVDKERTIAIGERPFDHYDLRWQSRRETSTICRRSLAKGDGNELYPFKQPQFMRKHQDTLTCVPLSSHKIVWSP